MVDSLVPRETFAALRSCVYLNQASLGLVPQASTEAMVRFAVDVAQHGNARLSDDQEARILDELREAGAAFLDAPAGSVAVVGGASEALGQLAAILASRAGSVVADPYGLPERHLPLARRAATPWHPHHVGR